MVHPNRDQKKLINRVRRLRGQIKAITKTLEKEKGMYGYSAHCRCVSWLLQ